MKDRNTTLLERFLLILCLSVFLTVSAAATDTYQTPRTEIRLISEVAHINAGRDFWVGVYFKLASDWHIYWRNPGDAGLAPKFAWRLPEGFRVVEIRWPFPETIMLGGLANFGYTEEVLIPVMLRPPATLSENEPVSIQLNADWLVCKEECIPESADLNIALPVKSTPPATDEKWQDIFNTTRGKLPLKDIGWDIMADYDENSIRLNLSPPVWYEGRHNELRFYPLEDNVIEHAGKQDLEFNSEGGYRLIIPRNLLTNITPDSISGVLVSNTGWRGAGSEKALYFKTGVVAANQNEKPGFLLAVLFAFAGGIILNLMPCVLPVLSLKILGFITQAGDDRRRVFLHGIIFTTGVLISFLVLAGILIGLQTGGEQLGWGYQLQSPGFIFILSLFLFIFALNLFGVFEMGTSIMGIGQETAGKGGWIGSFMSGVTATVVATPCTAPFMGTALGFAVTQPATISLAIFAALGLGMAAPYLLISAAPGFLRFVPKPGRWMETLKQFMGFLLVGTVIWLIWVFSLQTGSGGVLLILGALLITAMAVWIIGRWGQLDKPAKLRASSWICALVLVALTIVIGLSYIPAAAESFKTQANKSEDLEWLAYSEEAYQNLRKAGQPLLLDFTAAWCLSCQVNEQIAFGSREVKNKLSELNIKLMKADWTRKDPVITRALAKYGRNSVPFYVVYGTKDSEPVILPEILTPAIVLDALEKIN